MSGEYLTIPINDEIAHVIMGAIRVAEYEDLTGTSEELLCDRFAAAQERLVRSLYRYFPERVLQFDDLPVVKKIKAEHALDVKND
jgi:hypothetical protein